MKSIKKGELLDALNVIKPFVKKNTVVPSLSNIYFRDTYIEAFNGTQGIRTNFYSGIECGVSGLPLHKIISSIQEEEIFLFIEDDDILTIKTEKSSYGFVTDKIQSFFPDDSGVEYGGIPTFFTEGLNKCLHFSEKDATLEDTHGVAICGNVLFSASGNGVSKFCMEDDIKMNHIVQNKMIKIMSSYKGDIQIGNNDKAFFIKTKDFDAFTIFPDVELLDYESIISQFYDDGINFVQIPFEVTSSIINIGSIAKKSQVKVSLRDKILCVSFSGDGVSIVDKVSIDLSGEFSTNFDATLLSNIIALSDELAVVISDETVVLVGRSFSKNFICLVSNSL